MTRWFQFIIFSLLLIPVLEPARWIVISMTLFSVLLYPRYRIQLISLASVFIWFVHPALSFLPIVSRVLPIGVTYALAYLCLLLKSRKLAVIAPFVVHFGLIWLAELFWPSGHSGDPLGIQPLLSASAQIYHWFLWPLVVVALVPSIKQRLSHLQIVGLLVPPWMLTLAPLLPIPLEPLILIKSEVNDERERENIAWKGLFLLATILIFTAVSMLFRSWAFGYSPDLNSHFVMRSYVHYIGNFDAFVKAHSSWPMRLTYAGGNLANAGDLFFDLFIIMSMPVAISRVMGFDLVAAFRNPFASTSFTNFLARILHYYNELLIKVFFPFFRRTLAGIVSLKYRVSAAVFLTVSLGGFWYHLNRDLAQPLDQSPPEPLRYYFMTYLNVMPYYLLLGVASSVFSIYRHSGKAPTKLSSFYRSFVYILIYAVIFSLDALIRHDGKTWFKFFNIWRKILLG